MSRESASTSSATARRVSRAGGRYLRADGLAGRCGAEPGQKKIDLRRKVKSWCRVTASEAKGRTCSVWQVWALKEDEAKASFFGSCSLGRWPLPPPGPCMPPRPPHEDPHRGRERQVTSLLFLQVAARTQKPRSTRGPVDVLPRERD